MPERPPLSSFEPPEQRLQKLPQRPPLESFDQMSGTVPVQGSIMGDIGTGLARAAAGTYASLPNLGVPENPLKGQARSFAAEPSTSTAQSVGEIAGNTLPYMLAPEIGAGKAALHYALPLGAAGYGLYRAYEKGGMTGFLEAAAGLGMGRLAAQKYLPNILALVRQHAGQLGGTLEKVGLGAATTAARRGESDAKDQ